MNRAQIPTKYMLELKKRIMDERNIAESSANLYINKLIMLNEKNCFNNLGFLKRNKEQIIEFLTQYEKTTEISFLTAIVSCLSTVKDQHLYKTIYKFYSDLLNEKQGIENKKDTGKKSETQKNNWIEWDDVIAKWNTYKQKVDIFKNDRSIGRIQMEMLIDFVVLSLYVLIPPRRNQDFLLMYGITKDFNKDDMDKNKNYFDYQNEEFIFNNYKTKKFYNTQTEEIPEELMDVLEIWIKHHPYLRVHPKAKEFKLLCASDGSVGGTDLVNYITLRLNKIFDKKKISSSILRHSYISSKFGKEFQEMKKISASMGHSEKEQRAYAKYDSSSDDE